MSTDPREPARPLAPLNADIPTPQESVGYQPISAWAIAGFGVSVLFAGIVAVCVIVALFIGAPVFLHTAIVTLPIIGIVLSWVGLTHVNNSEGTRAGAKLARIGIWLSLVPGLCYFSYWYFTGLALQNQANAFLMEKVDEDSGFFARLMEDSTKSLNHAFLLTLPPSQRGGLKPENEAELRKRHDKPGKEGPGALTQFKDSWFARIFFKDLGKTAEITPLTVHDWKHEGRRYRVQRLYRVTTKEVAIDLFMTVESMEGENPGEGRRWYVKLSESGPAGASVTGFRKLTPVGEGVAVLRRHAATRLHQWFEALNEGQSWPEFKDRDDTAWSLLRLSDADRTRARAAITQAFTSTAKNRLQRPIVFSRPEELGRWEETSDKRVRFYCSTRFAVDLRLTPDMPGAGSSVSMVDATIVVESKQPINLAQVAPDAPSPEWEVARLAITFVGSGGGMGF